MGDSWVTVLPTDPFAAPPKERREAAFELLQEMFPGSKAKMHISENPYFFYCGVNLEYVFCPFCATEIQPWWMEEMSRWWESDRTSLSVETPCCCRATTLNDLDYVQPQGFACVAVDVENNRADLEPHEMRQIETVLGLPVRLIRGHI